MKDKWSSIWNDPEEKRNKEWERYYKEWEEKPDDWTIPKKDYPEPCFPFKEPDPYKKWRKQKEEWEQVQEMMKRAAEEKKLAEEARKSLFKEFVHAVEKLQQTGNLHQFLKKVVDITSRANNVGASIDRWIEDLLPEDKLRDFIVMSAFGRKPGEKK